MEILDIQKVRKDGNNYIVTLSEKVIETLGITEGDEIVFLENNNEIYMRVADETDKNRMMKN